MKKVVLSLLILCICITAFVSITASAATYGQLTYTVSKGEATITKCDTSASGTIAIPNTLGGYPVTNIDNYAFKNCNNLTSVTLPKSVTRIGIGAFYNCSNLVNINIGNNVTTIAAQAFYNCSSLTDITLPDGITFLSTSVFSNCSSLVNINIPNSVTTIYSSAFSGCNSLTSVTIPNSVTNIGSNTFSDCKNLTHISMGNGVTSIGEWTFFNCEKLTSISIPDSVTSIGDVAFLGCINLTYIEVDSDNPNYSSLDGVLFNKNKTALLLYPPQKTNENYIIPNKVSVIGDYAFYGSFNLKNIEIPQSTTSIGQCAFAKCSNLSNLHLPGGLISIGSSAFCDCASLTEIVIPDTIVDISDSILQGCNKLESITLPKATFGDGVASRFGYLFGYEWLETQNPPKGSTYQGYSSITNTNYGVYSIYYYYYIPETLKNVTITGSIEDNAFYGCNNIETLTIGENATSIGVSAFYGCSSLENIYFKSNILSIENNAFEKCYNINKVSVPDLKTWMNITFQNITSNPLSSKSSSGLYINDVLITDIEIPNDVEIISSYAFYNCKGITSITIPEGVKQIGCKAFYNLLSLENLYYNAIDCADFNQSSNIFACDVYASILNLTIGENVTHIPAYFMYNNTNIETIGIPNSVTKIGISAFENCNSINSVYIEDLNSWLNVLLENATSNPAYNCSNVYVSNKKIDSLIIPEGTERIFKYTFYNWTDIKTIILPSSLKAIDEGAFADCQINVVNIPNIETWLEIDFCNWDSIPMCWNGNLYIKGTKINNIVIPDSITKIKDYAFANITGLQGIFIGTSIREIGDCAFHHCSYISNICYTGTEDDWKNIVISETGNSNIINKVKKYNCKFVPTENGNFIIDENNTLIKYVGFDEEIEIPNYTKTISAYAFENCISSKKVIVPNSVIEIGEAAFYGCNSLVEMTLPFTGKNRDSSGSYESVFGYIFGYSSSSAPERTQQWYNDRYSKYYNIPQTITTVSITDDTELAHGAFNNCANLSTINISQGTTHIPSDTFKGCSSLKDFHMPNTVINIQARAFSDELENLYITDLESWCNIEFNIASWGDACGNPLSYAENLYIGDELQKELVIPDTVNKIKAYAFYNFSGVEYISFSDTITSVGYHSFDGCVNLKSVKLPNNLTVIGTYAFANCTNLKTVTIPGTLEEVAQYAFTNCGAIESVSLGVGISEIGSCAFFGCNSVHDVYYSGNSDDWKEITILSGNDCLLAANLNCSDTMRVFIIFDANSGECAPIQQRADENSMVTLTSEIPTKEYYKFLGWAKSADATKAEYKSGDSIAIGAENVTLYAVWQRIVVTNTSVISNIIMVTPTNAQIGDCIIAACYMDGRMVYMDTYSYNGETTIPFIPNVKYDTIKIMVWESLSNLKPLSEAEEL